MMIISSVINKFPGYNIHIKNYNQKIEEKANI